MTDTVFVKRYREPHRAAAAHKHHAWLASLDSGVRLPRLRSATPSELVFEHLDGRHPGPHELDLVARTLGRLHSAAYSRHLNAARIDETFRTPGGLAVTDFVTPRRAALRTLGVPVRRLPVALYKDANIRNFLLTDDGVALIDFDDLTLAPFGYDLAKLIVSAAMTHGRPDAEDVEHALDAYNTYASRTDAITTCSQSQLRAYTEIHHQLTAPYLHRNGYHHAWPDVKPWPAWARPARECTQ